MKSSFLRFVVLAVAVLAGAAPALAVNTATVIGAPCNMEGSFGMALNLATGSTDQALVQDNTPDMETTFRVRFRIDPNSVAMNANKDFAVLVPAGPLQAVLRVTLLRDSTGTTYRMRAQAKTDPGEPVNWIRTNAVTIGNAARLMELEWGASTSAVADDGFITLTRIDNGNSQTETGIDNDEHVINRSQFGAVTSLEGDVNGTVCLDDYSSFR